MKPRFATLWLGGCSGCHMSFLDLDEWLLELFDRVELVYGPLVDTKEFPNNVDLTLVEGAVTNQDNLDLIRLVRRRTKVLVSFGDCAVTGNVTALRNSLGNPQVLLQRSYRSLPIDEVPTLLPKVLPVHQVVTVDHYLQGCPPTAAQIQAKLEALLGEVRP